MHLKSLNAIVELSPTLLSGAAIMEMTSQNILSSMVSWDHVLEEKIENEGFVPPKYWVNTQYGMHLCSGAITDQIYNFEQVIYFSKDHYEY